MREVFLSCVAALAVLFASGHSLAVELSKNDGGQVLLFPFFTSEQGWDSYINITLGGMRPVAIKLRVRSGDDGREINSFNIYGVFNENWGAAITRDASGQTILRIAEGSCTISDQLEYGGVGTEFPLGASVGALEVYEVSSAISFTLAEADCSDFAARWETQGEWTADPNADMRPTGAVPFLYGEASLVNVEQGLAAMYPAVALRRLLESIPHTSPASDSPNLADADAIVHSVSGPGVAPESGEGIDAVAMVLAGGDRVTNQVVNLSEIGASTDWVISYPLAGYKDYKPFTVMIDGRERNCESLGFPPAGEDEPVVSIGLDPAVEALRSWGSGRYLGFLDSTPSPMPAVDATVDLCSAVNIVSFDDAPSILAPEDAPHLTRLQDVLASDSTSALQWSLVQPTHLGVKRPVFGFRLTTFVNGTLQGGRVLANYAVLREHVRE